MTNSIHPLSDQRVPCPPTPRHRTKLAQRTPGAGWHSLRASWPSSAPVTTPCGTKRVVSETAGVGASAPHETARAAAIGPKSYRRRPQLPL